MPSLIQTVHNPVHMSILHPQHIIKTEQVMPNFLKKHKLFLIANCSSLMGAAQLYSITFTMGLLYGINDRYLRIQYIVK